MAGSLLRPSSTPSPSAGTCEHGAVTPAAVESVSSSLGPWYPAGSPSLNYYQGQENLDSRGGTLERDPVQAVWGWERGLVEEQRPMFPPAAGPLQSQDCLLRAEWKDHCSTGAALTVAVVEV